MTKLYARLRSDNTNPKWGYASRSNLTNPYSLNKVQIKNNPQQAASVRMTDPTGALPRLSAALQTLVAAINTPSAFNYVTRWGSGWLNSDVWPQAEPIAFVCNVVEVLEVSGRRTFVKTITDKQSLSGPTYETDPTLIHSFTVIDPNCNILLPPVGVGHEQAPAYTLVVTKSAPAYVATAEVEFFPPLPCAIKAVQDLIVFNSPNSGPIDSISAGSAATVTDYLPLGSNVWGKMESGWILLCDANTPGWFTTTWKMETLPPPVISTSVPPASSPMTYERRIINNQVCHIHTLDAGKVKAFVSPNGPRTVQEAQSRWGMKLWINGDMWDWNFPTHPFGRAMSNGATTWTSGKEATIYFGQQAGQIAIAPPFEFTIFKKWNAVSFLNHLIVNGAHQKTWNDTIVAARTLFGISKDRSEYIVCTIEGVEYVSGATMKGAADILLALGVYDGVLFDSGGSTQFVDADGNSYSVEGRRTINQLGFYW